MEKGNKRPRAPNYSQKEKELLLNLMAGKKHIIETKKTDGPSVGEKKEAWKEIEKSFNGVSPELHVRPAESLKKFYEKLKEDLRKRSGDQRKHLYTTGGGPPQKIIDSKDELLLSIVKEKSVYGLDNQVDCDAVEEPATLEENQSEDALKNVRKAKKQKISTSEQVRDEPASSQYEVIFDQGHEDDEEIILGTTDTANTFKPMFKANPALKENVQKTYGSVKPASRRRPTVMALTSSHLGEKYEELVAKKIELLDCYKKEHTLRMESLSLDIAIKKKQLAGTSNTEPSINNQNFDPLLNSFSL